MNKTTLSAEEQEAVRKYFGKPLEELDEQTFRETHRKLRSKYHPDNFEKFEDETVREMAQERFQLIEQLAEKVRDHLKGGKLHTTTPEEKAAGSFDRFGFDDMKIEINTHDKDLKYHLFGSSYRWLVYGDRFKIPGTGASIIIDEDHQGHRIGFRESIRLYLTFGGRRSEVENIVDWLLSKIQNRATSLLIEGGLVAINREAMLNAVEQVSLLPPGE